MYHQHIKTLEVVFAIVLGCAGAVFSIRKHLQGQMSFFSHMDWWARASATKLDRVDLVLSGIAIFSFAMILLLELLAYLWG